MALRSSSCVPQGRRTDGGDGVDRLAAGCVVLAHSHQAAARCVLSKVGKAVALHAGQGLRRAHALAQRLPVDVLVPVRQLVLC